MSVNKARVAGIDRYKTKTGEDRRIQLCPRALSVLERQLRLRARLQAAGRIRHDHVFFKQNGEPLLNLQYTGTNAWNRVELSFPRELPNSAAAALSGFSVATAFAVHGERNR